MRAWLRLLVLLVAAVALALWLREHGGNVILAVPPWRIQFSTTLGVVLLIAFFIALHLALRALAWLGAIPTRLRHWRGQRVQQRDHDLFERGWISLMAGDTQQAERDLTRLIAQTRVPGRKVMAALAAARAVQVGQQAGLLVGQHAHGQDARCQTFLTTAQDYMGQDPALARAVAATSAEILLDAGLPAEALARLTAVPDSQNHPHLARLQLRAHEALGQHELVLTLARQGLRRGWLARDAATPLIDRAGAAVLRQAASQPERDGNTADAWLAVWKDLKTEERVLPHIALAAAGAYAAADQPEDAARVLEAAIKQQLTAGLLSAGLLTAYANCDASQVSRRLTKAETWLTAHPDNPDLLCALATLCLTGQIWGAAERYLQRSLRAREDARAHALLGSLYDRLGRASDASRHWQEAAALGMALPVLAMDAPLPAADTHADPIIPDAEAPSVQSQDRDRPAATPQRPAPTAAALAATAAAATSLQRADIEDLFDSAPIPGLDPAGLDPAGLEPAEPGAASNGSAKPATAQPAR